MGTETMQVQVIGLSHTNALRDALKTEEDASCAVEIIHMLAKVRDRQFIVRDSQGMAQLADSLRTRIQAPGERNRLVVSQVGGSAHHFLGFFQHAQPYDFRLASQPDLPLDSHAWLLTQAYLLAALRRMAQMDLDILTALAGSTGSRIVHLECPPPVADSGYCQRNLPPAFQAAAYAGMTVAEPVLRYKLWRLYGMLIAGECRHLEIDFIPCPREALDADGFLLPCYWGDPLHGNAAYGALLLGQIEACLRVPVHERYIHA